MKKKTQFSHQLFRSYLNHSLSVEQLKIIERLKEEDVAVRRLLEWADESEITDLQPVSALEDIGGFGKADELLTRIFAHPDSAAGREAVQQLAVSPQLFERVLLLLQQVEYSASREQVPEMSEVIMETDENLLARLGISGKVKPASPVRLPRRRSWFRLQMFPRYALAVATMLVVIYSGSVFYQQNTQRRFYNEYVYSQQALFDYDLSRLRGEFETTDQSPNIQQFYSRFSMGVSEYLLKDYARALNYFDVLKQAAHDLFPPDTPPEQLRWLRDLYFYSGLSHLMLSRSSQLEFWQKTEKTHLTAAVTDLQAADSLAQLQQMSNVQRETYYLGLALGLAGQKQEAVALLKQIETDNTFYGKSQQLLDKWSD